MTRIYIQRRRVPRQRSPTHPGEVLKEGFLVPLGLTQVKLAKALKTSFRTINEILNEKRSISPDIALRLARYFGTTPEVWIVFKADYDLYWAGMDPCRPLCRRCYGAIIIPKQWKVSRNLAERLRRCL